MSCNAAHRPLTPSIVLPISFAIVAKGCLAAIRWRSSVSASSVQRERLMTGPPSRMKMIRVLARSGCTLGLDRAMLDPETAI